MPVWLIALIGAIVGFALTMLWDFFKYRKEAKKKEDTIASTVTVELNENKVILHENLALLEKELRALDENKCLILPLIPLHREFLDLLKSNLPYPRKYRDLKAVMQMFQVAELTSHINETMRSREIFRIYNLGNANYIASMKVYDQRLLADSEKLLKVLNELEPMSRETERFAEELVEKVSS